MVALLRAHRHCAESPLPSFLHIPQLLHASLGGSAPSSLSGRPPKHDPELISGKPWDRFTQHRPLPVRPRLVPGTPEERQAWRLHEAFWVLQALHVPHGLAVLGVLCQDACELEQLCPPCWTQCKPPTCQQELIPHRALQTRSVCWYL